MLSTEHNSSDIRSTEMTVSVSEAELGKSSAQGSDPREDNTRDNPQQEISLPLGVELTGYRLLTTGLILGLGIPKAVYAYSGQSLISTTLDWVAGIILALILFWLGVIEARRPELSPGFFQADLAPPILKVLRRPETQLWFLSVPPLLLSTNQLRAMLDARRDDELASGIPAYQIQDALTLAVLAFSASICIFCLQCLRIVWPRGFKGTTHHVLLFVLCFIIWLAYDGYLILKVFKRSSEYPKSIIKIAVHNVLWTYPLTLLPFSRDLHGHREGYIFPLRYNDLMTAAYVVLAEATFIAVWGLPDFPEGQFLVTVPTPKSLVPSFSTWGLSMMIYDRICRAGSEVRSWVFSMYDRVLSASSKAWI